MTICAFLAFLCHNIYEEINHVLKVSFCNSFFNDESRIIVVVVCVVRQSYILEINWFANCSVCHYRSKYRSYIFDKQLSFSFFFGQRGNSKFFSLTKTKLYLLEFYPFSSIPEVGQFEDQFLLYPHLRGY